MRLAHNAGGRTALRQIIIANTGDGRHLRAAAQAVLERLLAKETNGTKEKHNRNIYIVLATCCAWRVFFVKHAVRAVEEWHIRAPIRAGAAVCRVRSGRE
ncbi:MAG: hypothetical protein ACLR7U_06770 [Ruthenibacterium lactatiformans]